MARVALFFTVLLGLMGISPTSIAADDFTTCRDASGEEAISACTRAISSGRLRRANLPVAYTNRGFEFKRKGDFDRAIGDYSEAIRLDPKYAQAYINRGAAYQGKGDHDRAITDYSTAIQLKYKEATAYYNRGGAYRIKGDNDRAIADFNEAIRLDPKDPDAYIGRGDAWDDKGDYERAISDHSTAIQLDPKNARTFNNRGVVYHHKGEYDRAIADYSEAIRLNPNYVLPISNRAFAYEKKGQIAEALADFRRLLVLDPNRQEINKDIQRLEQTVGQPAATSVAAVPPARPAASSAPPGVTPARAGARVALVIGNGAYQNAPPLTNPPNDAADMAVALRKLGFDVVDGRDLDRRGMETKIREFGRKLQQADLGMFFYAGHGLQVTGKNYLVPIDAKLEREGDLSFEAIDVGIVLQQMESGSRVNLVFLDACRNNPLARSLSRSLGIRSAAVGSGLASIQSGIGSMIVYSTQPDNVALDGDGRNSPFTAALLAHVADPGIDIGVMMRRVRADVIQATQQKQVPWDHSSLVGEVVLAW